MAFQGLSKNESLTLQGSNNNSPGRSPGYRYREDQPVQLPMFIGEKSHHGPEQAKDSLTII